MMRSGLGSGGVTHLTGRDPPGGPIHQGHFLIPAISQGIPEFIYSLAYGVCTAVEKKKEGGSAKGYRVSSPQ